MVNVRIIGISGSLTSFYKGTAKWDILNNLGVKRILIIANTYFIKSLPMQLLSPQHIAQLYKKTDYHDKLTVCKTYDDKVILKWNNHKLVRTVRLNQANVPVLYSASSSAKYNAVCEGVDNHNLEPKCFATHIILGDEE